MITLICTHCHTELSIDDAFAGGVCRCQYCGTIQTVPRKSGDSAAGASNGSSEVSSGRSLYKTQPRDVRNPGGGSGLDDLAEIVASSGLGGSGLSRGGLTTTTKVATATPVAKASKAPLLIGISVAVLVIAALVMWLEMKPANSSIAGPPPDLNNSISQQATNAPTPASAGPNFCGMPLTGHSVVFLLDRGGSAREIFDALKQATFGSIMSLGPERKFQVLFWDNETTDDSFPRADVTFATADNLKACQAALADVVAFRQSSVDKPLKKAVTEAPDEIVLATAKGFELDDSFAATVQSIVKGSNIKIDAIALRGADCAPLKKVAADTGGTYRVVTDQVLQAAAPPE